MTQGATVELYWIPLGAGTSVVRCNGIVYEHAVAAVQRRSPRHLFHSALALTLPHGRYMVEMAPVPDGEGRGRGVVAEGPVGLRSLGRFRVFRYEVRCWRDGVVPDLVHAVGPPLRLASCVAPAQAVFDQLPRVPQLVWGRDEAKVGDMWSCNSVIAWTLSTAGIDASRIELPTDARAPGWDAGIAVARRAPARAPAA